MPAARRAAPSRAHLLRGKAALRHALEQRHRGCAAACTPPRLAPQVQHGEVVARQQVAQLGGRLPLLCCLLHSGGGAPPLEVHLACSRAQARGCMPGRFGPRERRPGPALGCCTAWHAGAAGRSGRVGRGSGPRAPAQPEPAVGACCAQPDGRNSRRASRQACAATAAAAPHPGRTARWRARRACGPTCGRNPPAAPPRRSGSSWPWSNPLPRRDLQIRQRQAEERRQGGVRAWWGHRACRPRAGNPEAMQPASQPSPAWLPPGVPAARPHRPCACSPCQGSPPGCLRWGCGKGARPPC